MKRFLIIMAMLCLGAAFTSPSAREAAQRHDRATEKLHSTYTIEQRKIDAAYADELRVALKTAMRNGDLAEANRINAVIATGPINASEYTGVWIARYPGAFWGKSDVTRRFEIQNGMVQMTQQGRTTSGPVKFTVKEGIGTADFAQRGPSNDDPEYHRFTPTSDNRLFVEIFILPDRPRDFPVQIGVAMKVRTP